MWWWWLLCCFCGLSGFLVCPAGGVENGTDVWEELRYRSLEETTAAKAEALRLRSNVAGRLLERWRLEEERERCEAVGTVHRETVRLGCSACGGDRKAYRDLWCPVEARTGSLLHFLACPEGIARNPRWFGHPQGTCYVGRNGTFLYTTVPKAATTALRQWSRAAFREQKGADAATWLFPEAMKPQADRMEGAALWDEVPLSVREKAVAFSVAREPLDRFASGWREVTAYERGPPERRAWGRAVLRRQRFFQQLSDDIGIEKTLNLFGKNNGADSSSSSENRDRVVAEALRDLACASDWNEHLTPQTSFFPQGFLDLRPAIAAHDDLLSVLPAAANRAGLNPTTARKFAKGDTDTRANARDGWPRPDDIRTAFDQADKRARSNPQVVEQTYTPTRFLWCWIYAPDYATFANLFTPPEWCDDAFADEKT